MIVPMQKFVLVILDKDVNSALAQIRALGIAHVELNALNGNSEAYSELKSKVDKLSAAEQVLVDEPERLAREADQGGQPVKIAVHEGDVGGLDGEVAAEGSHGDAHVACGECGCVVDAVSDHRDAVALFLELADDGQILLFVRLEKSHAQSETVGQ